MKNLPLALFGALLLAACSHPATEAPVAARPTPAGSAASVPAQHEAAPAFTPPSEAGIPGGPLGDEIRLGRAIFTDTPAHAHDYVGNGLSCSNCHLDAGRLANSAPLWGAWGMCRQYR